MMFSGVHVTCYISADAGGGGDDNTGVIIGVVIGVIVAISL